MAEKHAMMAFASESELSKPRTYYYNIGISVGKDGKRGCVQCKGHMLAATARGYAYCGGSNGGDDGSDTTIASTRRGQGDDGAGPAQARQGETIALQQK